MIPIDLALACVIVLLALRGAWRGFFRETFGFAGLVSGIAAAFIYSPALTSRMRGEMALGGSTELHAAVAFVLLFVTISGLFNIAGYVIERVVRRRIGVFSALGGAVAGAAKGTAATALALLCLYLLVPEAHARLNESRLARQLILAAGNGLRTGAALEPHTPPKAE